jgi:hypothetical protein
LLNLGPFKHEEPNKCDNKRNTGETQGDNRDKKAERGGRSVSRNTSGKNNPRKNSSEEKKTKLTKMDQIMRMGAQTGNMYRYFQDGWMTFEHHRLCPGEWNERAAKLIEKPPILLAHHMIREERVINICAFDSLRGETEQYKDIGIVSMSCRLFLGMEKV